MKLSRREGRMLVLLAFFALWVLTFNYIIAPEYSRMNAYAMQLKRLESRREEIEITTAMKYSTAKTLEEQLGARDGEDFFYHDLDPVGADLLVQSIAKEAGLRITSMSLQKAPAADKPGTGELEAATNEEDSIDENLPLSQITVAVNVRGTMAQAMKFLNSVYEEERAVIVSRFELQEIDHQSEVQGTVTILIYSLDEEADNGRK